MAAAMAQTERAAAAAAQVNLLKTNRRKRAPFRSPRVRGFHLRGQEINRRGWQGHQGRLGFLPPPHEETNAFSRAAANAKSPGPPQLPEPLPQEEASFWRPPHRLLRLLHAPRLRQEQDEDPVEDLVKDFQGRGQAEVFRVEVATADSAVKVCQNRSAGNGRAQKTPGFGGEDFRTDCKNKTNEHSSAGSEALLFIYGRSPSLHADVFQIPQSSTPEELDQSYKELMEMLDLALDCPPQYQKEVAVLFGMTEAQSNFLHPKAYFEIKRDAVIHAYDVLKRKHSRIKVQQVHDILKRKNSRIEMQQEEGDIIESVAEVDSDTSSEQFVGCGFWSAGNAFCNEGVGKDESSVETTAMTDASTISSDNSAFGYDSDQTMETENYSRRHREGLSYVNNSNQSTFLYDGDKSTRANIGDFSSQPEYKRGEDGGLPISPKQSCAKGFRRGQHHQNKSPTDPVKYSKQHPREGTIDVCEEGNEESNPSDADGILDELFNSIGEAVDDTLASVEVMCNAVCRQVPEKGYEEMSLSSGKNCEHTRGNGAPGEGMVLHLVSQNAR